MRRHRCADGAHVVLDPDRQGLRRARHLDVEVVDLICWRVLYVGRHGDDRRRSRLYRLSRVEHRGGAADARHADHDRDSRGRPFDEHIGQAQALRIGQRDAFARIDGCNDAVCASFDAEIDAASQ